MYILLTFWALLALFWRALDWDWTIEHVFKRRGVHFIDAALITLQVRAGIRWAAAAAVPALVLVWLLSCAMGYGALWDSFFPAWFSDGATAAGGVICDYLLDNLFWEVR